MEVSRILNPLGAMSQKYGLLGMAYGAQLFGIHDQSMGIFGFLATMAGQARYFMEALLFGSVGCRTLRFACRTLRGMTTAAVRCGLLVSGDEADGFAVTGGGPHAGFFGVACLTRLEAGMIGDFFFFIRNDKSDKKGGYKDGAAENKISFS